MSAIQKLAATAALVGLVATSGLAFAQTTDTGRATQHGQHSTQDQGTAHGQGMMQGHGMMEMMHNMMHGQGMGMMRQGMMGQGAMAKGDQGPASLAYRGINDRMHRDMDFAYTGNADVDFAKGMIAHHQGAIDMAKVVLAFGENAEIKKLAEEIIKAQEGEIAFLNEWLEKQGQ